MADELDGLLGRVEDPALRAELRAHVDRIRAKRTFGLVFESHLPERVRLPERPVRPGTKVVLRDDPKSPTYQVVRVRKSLATVRPISHADGSLLSADQAEAAADEEYPVEALVVMADFGEAIYPGLRRLGTVDRGGDKPAQVVIKGENHHVLEALQFTHAGKVDCIYIDPPYNTGARDWKYDNDYVDDSDAYRHSKWLAFMERRLLLAKQLLRPERAVLIVTIDEKEYLRLGLLLEQLFPGVKVQMVTIVINAPGQARRQELARVEEYAFFLFLGGAHPSAVADDLLNDRPSGNPASVRWESLLRSGTNSRRVDRPALFYPVFVSLDGSGILAVGDSKSANAARSEWPSPADAVAVWPLKSDGSEGNWRASPDYLRKLLADGHARVGDVRPAEGRGTIWYLGKAALKKIETGEIEVVGRDSQGAVQVVPSEGALSRRTTAKTVWNRPSHHAGWHGSALVRGLLPGRSFPFPKALYSVEDALRIATGDTLNATVLDFFAGSGTTAHAVARLNRQDGGRRQAIVVTNNEVSPAEADALRREGHRPGDPEWEALGIFEHITRPRVAAAITGLTPEGEHVRGDYKFTDEFPMAEGFEENVEFLELTYQDADDVELDLAFEAVAPLLWLRAGGQGPVIESRNDVSGALLPFAATDRYGVLFDTDRWRAFLEVLPKSVATVFVVTDSPATFAGIAADLPEQVEVVRLYENYLTTFRINEGLV